ncbi:MAG: aminopeptidase [Candidatus Hermodarchaeota archaeon]
MYADFSEKLAKLVVRYSVNVQPGDTVYINAPTNAEELVRDVYREVIQAGGHVIFLNLSFPGQNEIFMRHASKEQLMYVDPLNLELIKRVKKIINIFSSFNTRALTTIDPKRKKMRLEANKKSNKIFTERAAKKELQWTLCPYPCDAFAQEANMGTQEYKEFVYKALALEESDPVDYWKFLEEEQDEVIRILDKGKELRIVGEDTDIKLAIEGRKWINGCGHENLPDGEVFTAPHEDGVTGTVRFTFPGIYLGQEIENIFLKFKDGKVIDYDATKGKDLLSKILGIKNANILGEIAFGTNYGIQKFTKNMLFDEKMGGTIHMALGNGYPESGSKNISAVHWDILKDMKSQESKIYLDNEMIYQAGKWVIP